MTRSKSELLEKSKVFCIIPWIHLHLWPSGDAAPCCYTDEKVGSLRDSSLSRIWNNESMRALRQRMLSGEETSFCRACYDVEKAGARDSLRNYANSRFGEKHWNRVVSTLDDGIVQDFRLVYMDFRFSNLCNFRCRSCGPMLSSSWYKDDHLLNGSEMKEVLQLFPDDKSFLAEVAPHLSELEEIYFAGGEPLITEEHYRVLELLAEKKLFHVRLKYSTNFSRLSVGKYDALKFWPAFKDVTVLASLDGSGKRGEYIRKGQHWSQALKNLEQLRTEAPLVKFRVQPTLSVFNAFHLPDFHRELVENLGMDPEGMHINPLFEPAYYSIQILPPSLKAQLKALYHAHIQEFLIPKNAIRSIYEYLGMIRLMESQDQSSELDRFREVTRKLDEIRGESFAQIFPELSALHV